MYTFFCLLAGSLSVNGQINTKKPAGDIIPNQYIVVLKKNALSQARVAAGLTYARRQQLMREDVSTLLSRNRVQNQKITQVYESAIRGFAVKNLSKSELEQLRTDSEIAYILPDQMTYLDEGVKTSPSARFGPPVVNSCESYVSFNNGTPITNIITATFGPQSFSLTAEGVLVDDGIGLASDACSPIQNAAAVAGKIAIIDRGSCNFDFKVDQAITAGAVGVLILNNSPTLIAGISGTLNSATSIPVLLIRQSDGNTLKTLLSNGTVTITMKRAPISTEQCTPWGVTRVGGGQTVTGKRAWIIDSGIDLTHEDLNVNTALSAFFTGTSANDENGHGSHVAGIIAALDNDKGVIGVAAGAEVVPVRVFGTSGSSPTSVIVAGINYVAGLAASSDVANLSLGGKTNQAYYDAIIGLSQKCSVVMSAGNDAINSMFKSPANINGARIYTVSAMDNADNFATFSNYGNQFVDFCAPGVNISSCYNEGGYAVLSGTSMAAPHVAGLILRGGILSYSRVKNDPDGQPDRIAELYNASKETDQDGDNYTVSQGDFNDNDNTIYPGAAELCDNKDNDCDGMIDEGDVCCPAGNTGVLYVNVNASGTNNGLSWTNAYTSLSAALADARKCSQITQIWVAKGTYYPTTDELGLTTTTTRFKTFGIREGLAIYGGFAGTEGSLTERNIQNNPTILSGDLQNNSITTDNAYHVVLNYVPLNVTTPVAATLSGFTITAGNANFIGTLYPFSHGGGVFSYGPISIDNVLFTNNLTNSSGGGLYINRSGGSSTITDTRFQQNRATGGAGFYIESAAATVISSTIVSNTATNGGGGAYVSNANTQFSKTQFLNNVSKNGSTGSGGGFQSYLNSQSTFTQCLFYGNQAGGTSDDGGGALMVYSGDVTLINTDIVGNSAATTGGAIAVLSTPNENSVTTPGSITVINSIIWGNTQTGSSITATSPGTTSVIFSLLQDASCPPTVTCAPSGVLYNVDPIFTNEGSGDLTLANCSPAINAGNPASATGSIGSTDLAGNTRIVGNTIDLGAYELQATPLVAITGQPVAASGVCAGETVTASVSVSGTVTGFQWYKDSPSGPVAVNGQSTSALSLSNVQATDSGSYSLVMTGSCNSVTSAAFSLTVNTLPAITGITLSSTLITCASPTVLLNATASGSGNSFSLSNGQTNQTGSFTISAASVYTLSVAGTTGCLTSTTVAVGSDNNLPSISISAGTTVLSCDAPAILLTAVSSETTLLWSTNAVSTTVSALLAGTFSVTATTQNGCSNTATITITGSPAGVGPVSTQVSGPVTSASPTAVITAMATGATSYSISGPGTTASNNTGLFTVSAPGIYQITASSGASANCSAAASIEVKAGLPAIIYSYPQTITLNSMGISPAASVSGQGISFVLTGPGGYVFSNVFRQDGQHQATARNIILPGSYLLTVTGSDGSQVQAIITVVAPASRIVLDTPGN